MEASPSTFPFIAFRKSDKLCVCFKVKPGVFQRKDGYEIRVAACAFGRLRSSISHVAERIFHLESRLGGIFLPEAPSAREVTCGGIFITIQCTHFLATGCWSTIVSANDLVPSGAPFHFNGMETLCSSGGRAGINGGNVASVLEGRGEKLQRSCGRCGAGSQQSGGQKENFRYFDHLGLLRLSLFIYMIGKVSQSPDCAFRETRKCLYIRTFSGRAVLL